MLYSNSFFIFIMHILGVSTDTIGLDQKRCILQITFNHMLVVTHRGLGFVVTHVLLWESLLRVSS